MFTTNTTSTSNAAPGMAASPHAGVAGLLATAPHARSLLGLALALGLLLGTDPAHAGWGFWAAAVALVAVAVVALAPVLIASAVIAALVVKAAVVVYFIAAVAWAVAIGRGEVFDQPSAASSPQPTDPSPAGVALTPITPIPLPGNAADPLIGTVNNALAAANTLSSNASQNLGLFQQDLAALRGALAPAGTDLDNLLASQSLSVPDISQADITAVMAGIAASGLPPLANDAMLATGLSQAEIERLTARFLSPDIHLAVPAVSVGRVFDIVAGLQVVPEPGSRGLVGIGMLAALATCLHRRRARANR